MKFYCKDPPRKFTVGNTVKFDMKDCGSMHLQPDEQITLLTEKGGEYDVSRKDWGFYATPSLNGRLEQFGLRGVLVRNAITGRYFVLLVECGKEQLFDSYVEQEKLEIITWMDNTEALDNLKKKLQQSE